MKRALVVDDSEVMRMVFAELVGWCGFEVTQAAHGCEALARLAEAPTDLAVVDWNMPVMNGLDLVEAIRADARFGATRILMVTSEGTLAFIERACAAGVDGFLTKPVSPEAMLENLVEMGFAMPHDWAA